MVKILRKFVSVHPETKGCFMQVREYKEKELPKDRDVKSFDIIRIEFESVYGRQIDCFVKPDELLELGELLISAYNNYSKEVKLRSSSHD